MTRTFIALLTLAALFMTGESHAAKSKTQIPLDDNGKKLHVKYTSRLAELRTQVAAAAPKIDEKKKQSFMEARELWNSLNQPGKDATPEERAAWQEGKEEAEAKALSVSRVILADVDAFLSSDKLDAKLMEIAVINDATPRGLAEFAQQGEAEQKLLNELFADTALMKQMLYAGGANGGEWGESMQVYTAILEQSKRARERGSIFQRLALGTALQQPWLPGKERGGVYGIVHADGKIPGSQVDRYMQYEKAYLDGELDPAFKDMNTWECRFITNDPYTDEELAWTREMLRNYRPDHITNPDYKWRYARMVKSDVPYCSPDWRPNEGSTKVQQIVAGGGKCGPRAFFGRTVSRAFGIPSRRSTQTGHAAMNKWTPDGWVVLFGAWWSWNWAGPWGGLDFLLESQTREHPEEFMKVVRAQWVGDALGEQDVSLRHYGKGGGFWNSLAFHKKQAVVADEEEAKLQAELAKLSAAEGQLLGETDEPTDDVPEKPMIELRPEDRTIVIDDSGVVTVPVAACVKPTNPTDRILFMHDLNGVAQAHYTRLGKRPELMKYYIELPKAGKYKLTIHVSTVARNQACLLRLNRRTLIDAELPNTWGMWADTEPIEVDLKEGRNTLMFTCKAPNRGVSLKHFTLTPVK